MKKFFRNVSYLIHKKRNKLLNFYLKEASHSNNGLNLKSLSKEKTDELLEHSDLNEKLFRMKRGGVDWGSTLNRGFLTNDYFISENNKNENKKFDETLLMNYLRYPIDYKFTQEQFEYLLKNTDLTSVNKDQENPLILYLKYHKTEGKFEEDLFQYLIENSQAIAAYDYDIDLFDRFQYSPTSKIISLIIKKINPKNIISNNKYTMSFNGSLMDKILKKELIFFRNIDFDTLNSLFTPIISKLSIEPAAFGARDIEPILSSYFLFDKFEKQIDGLGLIINCYIQKYLSPGYAQKTPFISYLLSNKLKLTPEQEKKLLDNDHYIENHKDNEQGIYRLNEQYSGLRKNLTEDQHNKISSFIDRANIGLSTNKASNTSKTTMKI